MVEPGQVLLGKYRIERVLGKGGMGVVALAHHLHLDQRVAIKFLLPEAKSNQRIVERFLREARVAVQLESEHVCHVHDVGTLESGVPYIVMEYLDGVALGELLARKKRMEPGVVVDYVLQACEGLAEAHARGVVHRDIKPANLFLTGRSDGSALIKVLDFGISKATAQGGLDLTHSKVILGTPSYMPPEQMRSSKEVDARADIWALGAVMYKLMTGRRPFQGENLTELCVKVALDPLPPMDVPLPDGLEDVIARCLEKEPVQRYPDVAALCEALAPFAKSADQARISVKRTAGTLGIDQTVEITSIIESDGSTRSLAADVPPVDEEPTEVSHPPSTIRDSVGERPVQSVSRARSGHWRWAVAGVGLLFVAAIVGVAVMASRESPEPIKAAVRPAVPAAVSYDARAPLRPSVTRLELADAGAQAAVAGEADAGNAAAESGDPAPANARPVRSARQTAKQRLGKADKLARKKKWRAAKELYREVLDEVGNGKLARRARLGLIKATLHGEQDSEAALGMAESMLAAQPNDIEARLLKIRIHETRGELRAAARNYGRLVKSSPHNEKRFMGRWLAACAKAKMTCDPAR